MLTPHPPPLRQEADGTLRVGESRVTLDTVIKAFKEGASLEAIVDRYPSLSLTDVYAVVTYYLWNATVVEEYLVEQELRGTEIRARIESRFPDNGFREKLMARRSTTLQEAETPPRGKTCTEILAGWDAEGLPSVYGRDPADAIMIARRLRKQAESRDLLK